MEGETPSFFTEFLRLIRLLLRLPPVEDGIMAHLLPEALGQSKNDPGRLVTAAQGSLPTANDQDRNVASRQMCSFGEMANAGRWKRALPVVCRVFVARSGKRPAGCGRYPGFRNEIPPSLRPVVAGLRRGRRLSLGMTNFRK